MRISRTTLSYFGGLTLLAAPPLVILSCILIRALNIDDFIGIVMNGAQSLAGDASTKQLVASIFLFLVTVCFIAGGSLYLLMCFIGVLMMLILRELSEITSLLRRKLFDAP